MDNSELSDIHFTDKEMNDVFTPQMGKLADKIIQLCDDAAYNQLGATYFAHPSTVELTPYINSADAPHPEIIVRAWHETGIPGKSAVFQSHDTALTMAVLDEDAFLVNEDSHTEYLLTTREAFVMNRIASMAVVHYIRDMREEE